MNKLKKFWDEYDALIIFLFSMSFLFWVPTCIHLFNIDNTPVDSTSEKGIEAKSLEYKGHKYLLFEKTDFFGPISVVHDPDCNKCK